MIRWRLVESSAGWCSQTYLLIWCSEGIRLIVVLFLRNFMGQSIVRVTTSVCSISVGTYRVQRFDCSGNRLLSLNDSKMFNLRSRQKSLTASYVIVKLFIVNLIRKGLLPEVWILLIVFVWQRCRFIATPDSLNYVMVRGDEGNRLYWLWI